MPHVVADRVLESTTSTGTGPLTLAGAVTGFRRFNSVCAVGATVHYFIEALDSVGNPTGDFEYGLGTYSGVDQLTRTTVKGSSTGAAAINLAAGPKNVGISLQADGIVSGSNANGSWKRHPDGTLEQWGVGTAGQSGSAWGNAFPVPFVGSPIVSAIHLGNDASVNVVVDSATLGQTSFGLRSNFPASPVTVQWRAIGRWIA